MLDKCDARCEHIEELWFLGIGNDQMIVFARIKEVMISNQKFNHQRHQEISCGYGIVTNGLLWQFIKLSERMVSIEPTEISLQPLDQLLGILTWLAQN